MILVDEAGEMHSFSRKEELKKQQHCNIQTVYHIHWHEAWEKESAYGTTWLMKQKKLREQIIHETYVNTPVSCRTYMCSMYVHCTLHNKYVRKRTVTSTSARWTKAMDPNTPISKPRDSIVEKEAKHILNVNMIEQVDLIDLFSTFHSYFVAIHFNVGILNFLLSFQIHFGHSFRFVKLLANLFTWCVCTSVSLHSFNFTSNAIFLCFIEQLLLLLLRLVLVPEYNHLHVSCNSRLIHPSVHSHL